MKTLKEKEIYTHADFENRSICVCAVIRDVELIGKKERRIAFGHAIRNPSDKEDASLAQKIAKGRALSKKHLAVVISTNLMLLNVQFIEMQIIKLINDIKENPHKYIKSYKK